MSIITQMYPGARALSSLLPPSHPIEPGTYHFVGGKFRKLPPTQPAPVTRHAPAPTALANAPAPAAPPAPAQKKLSQAELAAARAAFTQVVRETREELAKEKAAAAPPATKHGFSGKLRINQGGFHAFKRRDRAGAGRAK